MEQFVYTWNIKGIKKQDIPHVGLNDVVIQAHWECIGQDSDGHSGTFSAVTPFEADLADPNKFILYEDLTEEQVIEWVQEVINNSTFYSDHISQEIQKQIDVTKYRVVDVGADSLPWADPIIEMAPEPTDEEEELNNVEE